MAILLDLVKYHVLDVSRGNWIEFMWFNNRRKVLMRLSEVWGVHRSGMLIRQRLSMPRCTLH